MQISVVLNISFNSFEELFSSPIPSSNHYNMWNVYLTQEKGTGVFDNGYFLQDSGGARETKAPKGFFCTVTSYCHS